MMAVVDVYLALALQLVVQLSAIAYFYGRMTERVSDLDKRVARIEGIMDKFLERVIRLDLRETASADKSL
jgi:hypothetical protein